MKKIEKVKEFMLTFGQEVLPYPTLPSKEIMKLRVELIREELKELEEAFENNDIVEVNDAFQDLQYVLDGSILACGMEVINDRSFDEVHRSNMSKACVSVEEAEATIQHYLEKDGTIADYKRKGDVYVVFRVSDNKTLKSINYSPADLKTILENIDPNNEQIDFRYNRFQSENYFLKSSNDHFVPVNMDTLPIMSDEEAEKEFSPFKVKKDDNKN